MKKKLIILGATSSLVPITVFIFESFYSYNIFVNIFVTLVAISIIIFVSIELFNEQNRKIEWLEEKMGL